MKLKGARINSEKKRRRCSRDVMSEREESVSPQAHEIGEGRLSETRTREELIALWGLGISR